MIDVVWCMMIGVKGFLIASGFAIALMAVYIVAVFICAIVKLITGIGTTKDDE